MFIIEMDLPGTQPEKVTIRAQGKILTVEGQRERRQYVKGTSAHLHERCEGRFSRSFEFDFSALEPEIYRYYTFIGNQRVPGMVDTRSER